MSSRLNNIVTMIMIMLIVASCGKSDEEIQKELDNSSEVVVSCSSEEINKLQIRELTLYDTKNVCNEMQNALSFPITVASIRNLSRYAVGFQIKGWKMQPTDISYFLLENVKLRNQQNSKEKLHDNLVLAGKIYLGTEGRINPQDIYNMLKDSGTMARTLSDEGIIMMASYMDIKRKRITKQKTN